MLNIKALGPVVKEIMANIYFFILYVLVNNFSVMSGWVFMG